VQIKSETKAMRQFLALLLTSAMILAAQLQAFAATPSVPNAKNAYAMLNGIVLYEKDVLNEQILHNDPNGIVNASVDGTDLVLTFNQAADTVRQGQTMVISLSNAEFWFKSRTGDIPFSLSAIVGVGEKFFTSSTTVGSVLSTYEMNFPDAFAADATYDKTRGLFFSDGSSTHNGIYYRFPVRADVQVAELVGMDGSAVSSADIATLRPNPTSNAESITYGSREIPYKMTVGVWGGGNTQAAIEVLPLVNLGVSGNVRQNTYPLNTYDPY